MAAAVWWLAAAGQALGDDLEDAARPLQLRHLALELLDATHRV